MHQTSCVRLCERITDLAKDMHHARRGHRAMLANE
jgi:hypothetical protein